MIPFVDVFVTNNPAAAYGLAVQIFLKMPPPPSVIQRLQYCESHLLSGLPSPVRLALYVGERVPSRFILPWPPMNFTSFIYDLSPAIHLQATARGFEPPASRPMPETIFVPPFGVSNRGLGAPNP